MSAADAITQDRVYRALKAEYLAGEFSIGARLELQPTADRLRSSKTPVREALHRLIGEGLVEPDAGGGFRVWQPTSNDLVQLYGWNGYLLLSLVALLSPPQLFDRLHRFDVMTPVGNELELVQRLNSLFLTFAEASGNGEAYLAVAHINARLLYTRVAEITDLTRAARELDMLTDTRVGNLARATRRRLNRYHERRVAGARPSSAG